MAEIAFEGLFDDGKDDEWGLDGWTSRDKFYLMLTTEDYAVLSHLDPEHCSQLAAALIEHIKEVSDASKESSS